MERRQCFFSVEVTARFTCLERFVFDPYPAKLIHENFHPLKVVSRYRDPQLQVAENYSYLFNFGTNICKS